MRTILLAFMLVAQCALAQLDDVAFVGSLTTASAATCTSWAAQTTDNDFWTYSDVVSQRIENSGTITICKIKALVNNVASGESTTVTFSIRTASNKGGTLIATTQSYTKTPVSKEWIELTFSSNPSVTGDFYLTWESATHDSDRWYAISPNTYSSTTYCLYTGVTARDSYDAAFEIWAMQ